MTPPSSKSPEPETALVAGMVSVVVGTKNSEATLARCLDSVMAQSYRPLEIVLVDNFSSDGTVDIGRRYTDRVYILGPERSTQYNFGFRVARGEYTYRIDSDFVLDPDVVRDAVNEIAKGYDAVVIPDDTDTRVSFWARVRSLEKHCFHDDELHVAARFFRTPVLRALDGYDVTLVAGEDYDLQNRLLASGARVGRITRGEIHLGEPKTLREIYHKQYFYGSSVGAFLKANPGRGLRQVIPIRIAYIRHWRDFVRNPDLAVGFFVYELVKYLAALRGWAAGKEQGVQSDDRA